jgi:hypothetical protein
MQKLPRQPPPTMISVPVLRTKSDRLVFLAKNGLSHQNPK